MILAIDHVQIAMPPDGEAAARAFYSGLLGLDEVIKPANLASRGGCWFASGTARLHLGIERDFRPARKAHVALQVADLMRLTAVLAAAGVTLVTDKPLPGYDRVYVDDPFGNRIELLQPNL